MRRGILWLLPMLAALACGDEDAPARPQWFVVVSTDAVIPLMGDRLLVELLDRDGELACPSCRREAVVAPPDKWPVSFGIASPSGSTEVYVRAQLYRGDRPGMSVDSMGALPPLRDGVNRVGMHLSARCLGKPVQESGASFQTCAEQDPSTMVSPPMLGAPVDRGRCGGAGTTDLVPGEEFRRCDPNVPYEGMACVPGGLFFLGDALAPVPSKDVRAVTYPERLAAIGTFLMDRREVTVGAYQKYLQDNAMLPVEGTCPEGLSCRDESGSLTTKKKHCTYRETPMTPEDMGLALSCVSWFQAQAYCVAQGKRLPTEVEWEYAASHGARETRYPWGDSPARCDSAYVARGEANWRDDDRCLGVELAGPAPAGFPHDRTTPPWVFPSHSTRCEDPIDPSAWPDPKEHSIDALAGGLSEWTMDLFAPYEPTNPGDPTCWKASTEAWIDFTDPQTVACRVTDPAAVTDTTKLSVRGGSWRDPLDATWSAARNSAPAKLTTPRPEIGFRCVRSL